MTISAHQRVALASFPRSGNTWLRCLLEKISGQYTGSVYLDRIMPRGKDGIVVKTHKMDSENFDRVIHLVRNPFDAIASYYTWRLEIFGEQVNWDDHIRENATLWTQHTQYWIQQKCDYFFIQYDQLRINPATQLFALYQWLEGKDPSKKSISLALNACNISKMRNENGDLGRLFFREGLVGQGYLKYSQEQKIQLINTLGDTLDIAGYSKLRLLI